MAAVVTVNQVYKDFRLPQEKTTTLKRSFINFFSRRGRPVRTQHALKDITVQVEEGEFFGVVGRNGSGKSTLLKIIAGIYAPTRGSVSVSGKLVPFIELGVGFNGELSGRDNVYLNGALLGFSRGEINAMYDEIVGFAELQPFMDQKLKNYSSGMQVRLAFSLATRARGDILLVDEVLAVGDADFQRKCFSYFSELKRKRKTVVFVSHDMNAVREYCDRAMLIEESEVKLIGPASDVAREYSLLFMNESRSGGRTVDGKRWGTGAVKLREVRVRLDGDQVVVETVAEAHESVDRMIYGIHFVAEDGREITAVNNRYVRAPDVENLQPGSLVTICWRVLNVFSDGTYTVTLTLVDGLYTTLDWFTEAATFVVKREDRSTTAVLPPLTVTARVSGVAADLTTA